MLSPETRLKEKYSNYTDEKTIWRIHVLDPQVPCDAITTFGKDGCGLLEGSDSVWSFAEGAKERYPDKTVVVEQIQRQWVVFDDPTEPERELFNNYRITRFKHDGNFTSYFTSLQSCLFYILDNALLHDYYKLEVYDSDNDTWSEWKSFKGRTINQIRR